MCILRACVGQGESRLRVGLVVKRFPVVSEVFVMNTACGVVDLGHDLSIIALDGPGDRHVLNTAGQARNLLSRLSVVRQGGDATRSPRFVAAPAAFMKVWEQQGLLPALSTFHPIAHRKRLLDMRPVLELAALGAGRQPDVLHCQFGMLAEPFVRHRRAGGLGSAIVVHFRGHDLAPFVRKRGRHVYRQTFETAEMFITSCAPFQEELLDLGCPPDRIAVIPSPVDLASFPWRSERARGDGPVRLITVGRLVEKKGISDALAAVAMLRRAGRDDIRYRVIGEGPERPRLEALARELGIADIVEMPGALPSTQVAAELAAADIFLGPSITDSSGARDATIGTIKEAALVGLPVVATRHGGIPELIEDGVTGLLVAEKDPRALSEAVARLLDAPEVWPELTRRARAAAERAYGIPSVAGRIDAVYREAVARRDATRRKTPRLQTRLARARAGPTPTGSGT
jgi:colanic acid/amylovoran biosynthesis glycosyltransferase